MAHIDVARRDHVCTITFNRPERLNAIDEAMVRQLTALCTDLADDAQTRVVVFAGQGKSFSAGGDLGDMAAWLLPDAAARGEKFAASVRDLSKPLTLALARVPQPIVASVRGHAIGVALQLVIMADLVIASETARFSLPQIDLAHTPDHGESWSLSRKIGLSRALQMALLAERIDGATAERHGLVNLLVADADLEARTAAVVQRLAASPPAAARNAKALLWAGTQGTLAEAMDREIASIGQVAAKADFVEAISAFGEKRAPRFTGA